MNVNERQRERLQSAIEWARKIEVQLAGLRERRLGEVHFRPAANGISMIGLLPSRPQRGRSRIRNLSGLAETFDDDFRAHCAECTHGRPTPEKLLQSFLIAAAYRAGRRMEALSKSDTDEPVWFVTDELALPAGAGGEKIVCDLLALHGNRPAVIELKPSRQLTRLVAQVNDYAALVDRHADLFEQLYSVILGRNVSFAGPCEKWIVWPRAPGHARDPREVELLAQGIFVVGYEETAERFALSV